MSDTESLSSLLANEDAPADTVTQEPAKDNYVALEDESDESAEAEKPAAEVKAPEPAKAEPDSTPKVDEKPIARADVAAIMDERRKRQELQKQLNELQSKTQTPKVDFYDNPEQAVSARVSESTDPLRAEVFGLKVQLAKIRYPDFDDAVMAFLEKAKDDPALQHRADTAPDSFDFIYQEGKRIKELAPFDGDIDKLVNSKLGATKAENLTLKQQLAAAKKEVEDLKARDKELSQIPRSLNSTPSAASPKEDEAEDDKLSSMFRNKF